MYHPGLDPGSRNLEQKHMNKHFFQKIKYNKLFRDIARKVILTVTVVATAGGTLWAMAAFTEPASGPASSVQDFAKNILGADNADNAASTSSVTANNDGSIVERQEFLAGQIGTPTAVPASGAPAQDLLNQSGSMTANSGMYSNRIVLMTPPAAYTEVCFKSGTTSYDAHSVSESTSGGNCVPGDIGYLIEKAERTANYWELAKQTCLQYGMRLPEPFEWKLACKNAATWSLSTMTDNWEWESNFALPLYNGSSVGVGVAVAGNGGCQYATWGWVGYSTGIETSYVFRCVR